MESLRIDACLRRVFIGAFCAFMGAAAGLPPSHSTQDSRPLPPLGLVVTSDITGKVLIFDGFSGHPWGVFAEGGGLAAPRGFAFGPDGDLYVASSATTSVLRYDGTTGVFKHPFVLSGSGGLSRTFGVGFGLDGNLLVTDPIGDKMARFDGTTGAFIDDFIPRASGGLDQPNSFLVHSDGFIYIASSVSGDGIFRYDGSTGSFIDTFVAPNSGGLDDPQDLVFGPDGNLYVSSHLTNSVIRFNGTTGEFIDTFVPDRSGGLRDPKGIAFGPDGNLYLASHITDEILRYDGQSGSFIDSFVPPKSGGLDGPIRIEFRSFNQPPSRPNVTILPEEPTSLDNLFALASGSVDPNFQPVSYLYSWLVEGLEVEVSPGSPLTGPVLPRRYAQPGQVVHCIVTPTDGESEGPSGLGFADISDDPCLVSADLFPDGEIDSKDLLLLLLQWKGGGCD